MGQGPSGTGPATIPAQHAASVTAFFVKRRDGKAGKRLAFNRAEPSILMRYLQNSRARFQECRSFCLSADATRLGGRDILLVLGLAISDSGEQLHSGMGTTAGSYHLMRGRRGAPSEKASSRFVPARLKEAPRWGGASTESLNRPRGPSKRELFSRIPDRPPGGRVASDLWPRAPEACLRASEGHTSSGTDLRFQSFSGSARKPFSGSA